MSYIIKYHKRVAKDIKKLKLTQKQLKSLKDKIELVSKNPFSKQEGGIGELLKGDLKNLLKFRFDRDYRVVYQLVKEKNMMTILIVGLRKDNEVYDDIKNRIDEDKAKKK